MGEIAKYFALGVIFTSIPGSIFALNSAPGEPTVLSQETQASPTPQEIEKKTPTPEPTKTPKPTPKATPTPSPIPTPTPKPVTQYSSQEINGFIEEFAGQYSLDPNILRHIAICESGFNPLATNGAYVGLYQFGPVTWSENRKKMGVDPDPTLRAEAKEAIRTASYLLSIKKGKVWPNCQP